MPPSHSEHHLLLRLVRRSALRWLLLGLWFGPMGAAMVWLTLSPMGLLPRWAGRFMGSALLLSATFLLFKACSYLFTKRPLPLQLVLHSPASLVWYYTLLKRGQPEVRERKRETTLFLCSAHRQRCALLVPLNQLEALESLIQSQAPRAAKGYSPERERTYKTHPLNLLSPVSQSVTESELQKPSSTREREMVEEGQGEDSN